MATVGARTRVGFGRWVLRIGAALLMLLAVGAAIAWWLARPPAPDAFYDAPTNIPAESGALLRSEKFARGLPAGARAWRMLYTTTREDGRPALASALIVAPASEAGGPRPVIAWAHGTTGIARGCAPSLAADPFTAVPALPDLLAEGWVYVATDYAGLGTTGSHAYLAGDDAARSVLDSVRAARRVEGLSLDRRTVIWGHSQGGNSALWTGMRAPDYAPDITVAGVAALAPATDLPALIEAARGSMFGKIVSAYVAHAYDKVYPDTQALGYLRRAARPLVNDIAGRCVGGMETLVSALETLLLPRDGVFARSPNDGAFGARLARNVPRDPIAAPVLIAQGEADDLVLADIQRRYVAALCAAGQAIDYRSYGGRDHISLLAPDSPLTVELIAWTRARLAGEPTASGCPQP